MVTLTHLLTYLVFFFALISSYPVIHSCEDAPETGIYTLKFQAWTLDVECDMDTDGGGWLVLLTRRIGAHDFYKPWKVYSDQGIGSPQTQYILPLKFFHDYLIHDRFELLEQMTEGSDYAWALYSEFSIGPQQNYFPLKKGLYDKASTNGGDHLQEMKFSTYDCDNDLSSGNCAAGYHSAGWFNACFGENPLGNYENNNYAKGIVQSHWKGHYVSLDTFSWKIRRSVCSEGFGSTCTKCIDGFHLPARQIFLQKTCLRDCNIEGCQKCVEAFYSQCKFCKSGYALAKDGKCHKLKDSHDPKVPNTPGHGEINSCNSTVIINKQSTIKKINIGL